MSWQEQASCHPSNRPEGITPAAWTSRWFPSAGERLRPALDICESCPVMAPCRLEADDDGIWGGQTARTRAIGAPVKQKPINHGTAGGAQTHYRRGERPCPECAKAKSLANLESRARRKRVAA